MTTKQKEVEKMNIVEFLQEISFALKGLNAEDIGNIDILEWVKANLNNY